MSKITKTIITFSILAAVAGGGYYWTKNNPKQKTSSDNITIATAQIGSIQTQVTSQGTLEPKDYVDVGAQVSGQIKELHVDYGDNVKSGDLIAEIDPKIYESQISSDEAQLNMLDAQLLEKQADLKQAQRTYTRNNNLFKSQAISKDTLEQAETALDVARAQIASLEAQIKQSQSSLDKDKTNLSYTKIYAPFSGSIVSLSVKKGQTVNANQTTPTIARVADLDTMTAEAQVAEADVSRIQPGMSVYFTTLGSDTRKWTGKVRQILPTPETVNNVVLYSVLVDVDNKDRALMTGMTTQMYFVIGKADDAVLIPQGALLRREPSVDTKDGMGYVVKTLIDGAQQEKAVLIGLTDRTIAQVINGLKNGDQVIVPSAAAKKSGSTQSSQKMPMPPM